MAIEFGTDEWIKAVMVELNESQAYRDAAKNWEGDFYFIINSGDGIEEDIYLYMDLWHGECRDAFRMENPEDESPEFTISATLPDWKRVLTKELDPIQGLITRRLKLKGNMLKVMRAPKAAKELVNCCAQVDTAWP